MTDRPTMFEFAGGAPAFLRLAESFYVKVKADPMLEPVFVDFNEEHMKRVALWLGEVFGGPAAYTAARGGHQAILTAHTAKHISLAQRARWVELMLETAREELPDDPLFQDRFAAYINWGTDVAREISQLEEPPTTTDPLPKWGWESP